MVRQTWQNHPLVQQLDLWLLQRSQTTENNTLVFLANTPNVICYRNLTSSANFCKLLRNLARCICLADSSPLPEKSVLYRAVALSTIKRANLFLGKSNQYCQWQSITCYIIVRIKNMEWEESYLVSTIIEAASTKSLDWWSVL